MELIRPAISVGSAFLSWKTFIEATDPAEPSSAETSSTM